MTRRAALLAVPAALAFGLIAGCGGSSGPTVTHADHLACRTVYRIQQLYTASGGQPGIAFAPGAVAGALTQGNASDLHLFRDMQKAAVILANSPNQIPAALAAPERDCKRLGITAANAENTR